MSDMTPFLNALKTEMGNRLMPAIEPGMAQQIAMCSFRLLGKLITDVKHLPELQQQSQQQYQALKQQLQPLISEARYQELDKALTAGNDFTTIENTLQAIVADLSADNSPAAQSAILQIINIENTLKADFMAAYNAEIALSEAANEEPAVFTPEAMNKLTDYMRQQFPGNDGLNITATKAIPGGFSKQTIFVSLSGNKTLPDTVVIRLDKSDSPVGTTVLDEFNVIETLFKAGVAVPEPFCIEATGKILGGAFLIVSKIEGSNAGDALDVKGGNEALSKDLAIKLALMHKVDPNSFDDSLAGAKQTTKERILQEIAAFEQQWRSFNKPSISLEAAFAWLKNNIDLADGPRSLIHKDVGCHNMLVKDDQVSAFLDWETAAIGNPAQDLGYVYKTVLQMGDWKAFMNAYADTGVEVPSDEQILYYRLWGHTWLTVMVMSAGIAFNAGLTNDIQLGYAGTYLISRVETQFVEELHQVLSTVL